MVERQKEEHGWEFLFLGANIDAVETAGQFGIAAPCAVDFHADGDSVRLNYEAVGEVIARVRGRRAMGSDWKDRITENFRRHK